MRAQRGFTLIELLVVFSIAALLVGVVPFAFSRMQESAQYRDVLRNMMSDLRLARQQARVQGREVRFRLDLTGRRFGIDGQSTRDIPEPLQVRATVAGIEMSANQVAAIRFMPEGGATGGSVDVFRPSGQGTRVRVDWLSGQISTESIRP
ncbi:GspH/FimT family pseudopilin [Curvibacter sp. RS43]|uniref:Type II secretion system protein H n=1 Tax=Curvibacter microcysteis TaxID=3026419 RepID=A0ABT5MA62_9BURK|nr:MULTISPECIES: GspH/FimT family pseudopilin [unclassified Curvibacter]MDD0811431.1 GspH/FimT family pseudopilin [Curvibacter sp. RS43]MDD0813468.1 GspH/FimT family pseudopilin [Curvibacter sp. HBC28]